MSASAEGPTLQIELGVDERDLVGLMSQLETFAARQRWSSERLHDVRLVVEELTLNAMVHGQQPRQGGWIRWTISEGPQVVGLQLEDGGVPFNPLTAPSPELDSPLDDRSPGGLGLHLVQALVRESHYERHDGQNRLRLVVSRGSSRHV